MFVDRDTKVGGMRGSYSEEEKFNFLTNDQKRDARDKVNKEAGTRRMFSHAIFTPGRPDNWLAKVEEEDARLKPDAWKGHTIGDNTTKHLSTRPCRLDDEKMLYPFYERLVKWSKQYPDRPGLKNVCVHKGLFSPAVEKQFPHLVGYSSVADVGKAAKDWPDLNFVIYHSAYRWVGGVQPAEGRAQWERTGRVEWTNDLADIPAQYGVKNVYGDLGQIFAWTAAAEPRLAGFIMGSLVKGLGADHVVWGTDSLWTGAPQWQIEALRRLEIPDDLPKKYGFAPLGPAFAGTTVVRFPRELMSISMRPAVAGLFFFCAGAFAQDLARGKALAEAQCSSCHPLARAAAGYTPQGWDTVLRMMANHGVQIAPGDLALIPEYLVITYPEQPKPPAPLLPV